MKRTVLLVLAAGVATLPALLGVTGNSTFGQRIPATIPSGATVAPSIDDRRSPTSLPSSSQTRAADDSTTASDNRGRGSDDTTTSSPTKTAATARSTSTATTGEDSGKTRSGDDSDGHDGSSGKGGSGKG